MKKTLLATALACLAGPVAAPAVAADSMIMNKGDIKWGDTPPSLPKGAKIAVLNGDPGKPGPFTIRLQMPAGYKIAPHWHSQDENLTLITGVMYLGMGETVDSSKATALKAGAYHYLHRKPEKGQFVIQEIDQCDRHVPAQQYDTSCLVHFLRDGHHPIHIECVPQRM